jgi:hypothetical protein
MACTTVQAAVRTLCTTDNGLHSNKISSCSKHCDLLAAYCCTVYYCSKPSLQCQGERHQDIHVPSSCCCHTVGCGSPSAGNVTWATSGAPDARAAYYAHRKVCGRAVQATLVYIIIIIIIPSSHSINAIGPAPHRSGNNREHCISVQMDALHELGVQS